MSGTDSLDVVSAADTAAGSCREPASQASRLTTSKRSGLDHGLVVPPRALTDQA